MSNETKKKALDLLIELPTLKKQTQAQTLMLLARIAEVNDSDILDQGFTDEEWAMVPNEVRGLMVHSALTVVAMTAQEHL